MYASYNYFTFKEYASRFPNYFVTDDQGVQWTRGRAQEDVPGVQYEWHYCLPKGSRVPHPEVSSVVNIPIQKGQNMAWLEPFLNTNKPVPFLVLEVHRSSKEYSKELGHALRGDEFDRGRKRVTANTDKCGRVMLMYLADQDVFDRSVLAQHGLRATTY